MLFKSKPVSATCVIFTSLSAPKLRTAASDSSLTSSPNTASFATESPPSVCNEPSVVLVASVVSSVFIIPPTVRVLAISTAPSISTTSKLVVPSTSKSPARSIPAAPAKTKSSVDASQSI